MYNRIDHHFVSCGLRCAAWLYLPEGVDSPPVIIMGHGVAAERTFALPQFAEAFVNAGYAVFLFDYRNHGDSEGKLRNWVSHWRHGQDWDAAIDYVRQLDNIDRETVVLWGSSFGGGHVIAAGSRHQELAGIVAQVPFVDGIASLSGMPISYLLKSTAALTADLVMKIMGKAYKVPVVGRPSQFAVMNTEESYDGYMHIVKDSNGWKNEMPARFFLSATLYRPTATASKIHCPTLIIAGRNDSLIPVKEVKKMADKIPNSTYHELECNHFEPYDGTAFDQNIKLQLDFLEQIIPV